MPKGTGVDATVDNGATAPKHNKKKRKAAKSVDSIGYSSERALVLLYHYAVRQL